MNAKQSKIALQSKKICCNQKKPKEEIVHTMLQEEIYYVFSDFKDYALRKKIEYKRLV